MSQYGGYAAGDDYGTQNCLVCGSSDFNVVGGRLACTVCGTEAGDFQETAPDEFLESQSQRRSNLRSVRIKKQQPQRPPPTFFEDDATAATDQPRGLPDEDVEAAGVDHLTRLQTLVWGYTEFAEGLFNCGGSLRAVVKKIWTGVVDLSDEVDKLNEALLMDDLDPAKAAKLRSASAAVVSGIPLHRSVPVVMLGLLALREPVMPADLVKATLTRSLLHSQNLVREAGGANALLAHVEQESFRLSRDLSLPRPEVNVGGLALRILHDLRLPTSLSLNVHRLHSFLPARAGDYFKFSGGEGRSRGGVSSTGSPYPFVLALVLVTLKLLFGLGGRGTWEGAPPVPSWTGWARDTVMRANEAGGGSSWIGESALSAAGADLDEYAAFLEGNVATGDVHELAQPALRAMQGMTDSDGREPAESLRREDFWDLGAEGPAAAAEHGCGPGYALYNEHSAWLHTDYQAVVHAMSHVFWVKPSFIHHAAMALEKMVLERDAEGERRKSHRKRAVH